MVKTSLLKFKENNKFIEVLVLILNYILEGNHV